MRKEVAVMDLLRGHPHAVQLKAAFEDEGVSYDELKMKYVDCVLRGLGSVLATFVVDAQNPSAW